MADDLPPGYYLDNFNFVLDFVGEKYPDLLTVEERSFAEDFTRLSRDARRLYVRLTSRKGPLFRDDKLNYAEIADIGAAIDELVADCYLDQACDADSGALLALLTRVELVALLGSDSPRSKRRNELEALCECTFESKEIRAWMPFRIVRPIRLDQLLVYRLLFFGNTQQDLTEFVLHELGISPYESYPIDDASRFYDERQVLEDTIALYNFRERAREVVEGRQADELLALAAVVPDFHEQLAGRAGKICNRIARELERVGEPATALQLYERSTVPPARERRARILARTGQATAAIDLCHQIMAAPDDEAEYEFAVSFAHRLGRKHGIDDHRLTPPITISPDQRIITITEEAGLRVEEQARRWFEAAGQQAFYVENGLMPGLFGLAFWDIIFLPLRGAFFNPFQRGPADLFTPEFRVARESLIEARMAALADSHYFRHRVLQTFSSKAPIANHFVDWSLLDETLLNAVFERIPVTDLLKIFRRLLRDLRHNRAGFPDLIVFPAGTGYCLVEVKGPGDTLQNNQKRWLAFFKQEQIPAQVVHVKWRT